MQDDTALARLLANVRLLSGLNRGELLELLGVVEKNVFAAGEEVFLEGDAGNCAYLIISGSVEVFRQSAGEKITLAKLGPGESFGEMSLVNHGGRTASVRALEPCVTFRIGKDSLPHIPAAAYKIYKNIAQVLSQRLTASNDALLHLNHEASAAGEKS